MSLKFLEKDERIPYIAEALELYRKAGIGLWSELFKKGVRPALLVIDMQETFISPDSPIGTKGVSNEVIQLINSAVENTRTLIDVVRAKKYPIVYCTMVFREDGMDGGTWGERNRTLVEYCARGSKWVEVDKRIAPQRYDYRIEKKVFSGFIGTSLLQILTSNRIDTCIITGLSISGCVRQTTIDAMSYGFHAVVPEECVGDRSIGPYKASLFDIMTKIADVVPLDEVLRWVNSLENNVAHK
jgi:maleamate amidohydrolase